MSSRPLVLGTYVHQNGTPVYSMCHTLTSEVIGNDSAQAAFATAAVIAFACDHSEAPCPLALRCQKARKHNNSARSTSISLCAFVLVCVRPTTAEKRYQLAASHAALGQRF